MRISSCCSLAASLVLAVWSWPATAEESKVDKALRQQAVEVLRDALDHADGAERYRAAKSLATLDYPQGIREVFATRSEQPVERIWTWELMADLAAQDRERGGWIAKIREVALDPDASDRLEAVQALGRLNYRIRPKGDADFIRGELESQGTPLGIAYLRVKANSGLESAVVTLIRLLQSDNLLFRVEAARALSRMEAFPDYVPQELADAARREATDSPARIDLVVAAALHTRGPAQQEFIDAIARYVEQGTDDERYVAAEALGMLGGEEHLPLLLPLVDGQGAARVPAACAVLRIGRRYNHAMPWQDWAVIGLYLLGMLAIGWYYSRRSKTREDYLLGNRAMRPLTVGISLFATLFSAITYLAMPGEMARYGPMVALGKMASYPLIGVLVGWLLIPFIMRLRITSAYELLESRLGLSVRMLGSVFFLALRLTWMAVIIYATTSLVLVPLAGLDPAYAPWICTVLALVTIAYTSMGGLRAVVVTDVVQTFILFGGAILVLIFISRDLGGVGAWWPSTWPSHWSAPQWGSVNSRSFFGAFLATLVWYVCTSGSDQMAIQRYLATKDAPAARRMLFSALVSSALALAFLSTVGLAVMAYFQNDPSLVPDGQRMMDSPDQLFPRFIAQGLPVGISGLVVAGVLAAAMSSLSSGLNSSCSVITVDFIDRFRRRQSDSEAAHVRLAKYVSVAVGLAVVLLSFLVGSVEGNLLAVTYKVCNLLTAPLFGLFFMAMFVPWATGRGTLVGAVFGLATVVMINYWELFTTLPGISFLWAMPVGLLVQVVVGMLASAVLPEAKQDVVSSSPRPLAGEGPGVRAAEK